MALVSGLVLTGCEGAKAPLGAPEEVALDSRLLGDWTATDDDGDISLLVISALNDHEYELLYREADDEVTEQMKMRAYASRIDGVQFANITCLNCDEEDQENGEEWFFFAFEFEGDDILLAKSLEDDVYRSGMKDLSKSTEIRAYVKAHMNESTFFESDIGRFERK